LGDRATAAHAGAAVHEIVIHFLDHAVADRIGREVMQLSVSLS
jgi:hypothetical protein